MSASAASLPEVLLLVFDRCLQGNKYDFQSVTLCLPRLINQIQIGYRIQSVLLLQQWRHRVVRAHAGLHTDARLPRDTLLDQPVEMHQRRTDIGDEEILEVDSFCHHLSGVNSIQVSEHCWYCMPTYCT